QIETRTQSDLEAGQAAFWRAVERFVAGEDNVSSFGAITILGKPAMEKLPAIDPDYRRLRNGCCPGDI
ncbi:MAG: hypothetical protein C0404_12340, partial [Verrucomicrobia bacterium]|nr:hypothetical protein [Verrucomicrobiota bacterium]